ncbi:mannitol dehydrogenase family protein [Ahrensia sp. R2A130]|uniref:mannitol dehydrogenase family protein n=1 Tax=Ahrensia sp. R2A130 TaxID=744979 RepID=UPI0001E0C32F|nr:mannitol dehydrogenase family protein [Ahrensia sp. R2A130]EFL90807.1 mannitol 2-dehydrogenase [Ahrensia sp. R2A130]
MTLKLSNSTLPSLPDNVAVPSYDRSALTRGILHIGLGNFHRAHQAIYLDRLFDMGHDHDWALVGASLRGNDEAIRADLAAQDWLTTVVELDPNGFSARVCGAMIDYAETHPDAVVAAMTDPAIRIVSLTITEGGYYIDATTGGFEAGHVDVAADAASPDAPKTVFGCILKALRARRDAGTAPFTIMSCDNLPENGHVARATTLGLAALQDTAFAGWVDNNVAFPNSMVDCITPATSQREIDMVADEFGIADARPVACEPFRQWVMEDTFTNGRPALENVGVEFVTDVAPYELMKLRILNGGHATIAYPAGLLDIHFVHDAMLHPLVSDFLAKLEREEIVPTVPDIPGVSKTDYLAKVTERFSNSAIGDTIPRLCFDGSNRQPKFILPVVEARLAAGDSVHGLALESALWCRYCYGVTEGGNPVAPNDPDWENLNRQAVLAKENSNAWLKMTEIYGALAQQYAFAEAFDTALTSIWRDGTAAVLEAYIAA